MNTQNMYNFFFAHFSKLAVVMLAFLAGEGAALIDTVSSHPAALSVLAGMLTALTVKYVDKWLEGRNKTIKTGDKILELEHAKQIRLEQQQAELLDEKEAYWKLQNDRLKAEKFERETRYTANIKEAREINHKAINQIMQQQNVILGMQRTMLLKGLEIPEVSMMELTKFMLPIWENEALEQNEQSQHTTVDTVTTEQE